MKEFEIQMFIGGRRVSGAGTLPVYYPFTGEITAAISAADQSHVRAAIDASVAAAPGMAALTAQQRAAILERAAHLLQERVEEFARCITRETGKPLRYTRKEAARSVDTLTLSADAARHLRGEMIPMDVVTGGEDRLAFTVRVPVGVVGAITPYNAPLNLMCHKVGPAIAAGNAMVLKPSPQGSLVAAMLAETLTEAGLPAGALNVVFGGGDVGEALVSDQRVGFISFTGSAGVGERICRLAGLRRVAMELGGNSATIVHADADLEAAWTACARDGFSNSGQTCISVQRIYVHAAVFDRFLAGLVSEVGKLKVGDPFDPESAIGTMISEASAQRVESWLAEAVAGGARIHCGGDRRGAAVTPTVVSGVRPEMKLVCEEVFGPVVSVIPYETLDEVFAAVNDSQYGLQAGVFTASLATARRAISSLQVGGVIINGTSTYRIDPMPYGGVKRSGIGREGPRFAAEEMTDLRLVVLQPDSSH